jgi:TolB-like protein
MKTTLFSILFIIATFFAWASELPRVAVADFDDMTGAEEDMGVQVSENFRTALAATGAYSMIERTQLEKILEEKKLQYSDLSDAETASEFGKIAGAEYVIVGSITKLNSEWTFNARMIDTGTSEVIKAAQARGSSAFDFFDMVDILVADFAGNATALNPADLLYSNDFSVPQLKGAKTLGSEVYTIDTEKETLVIGDGKGHGEEMRCGLLIPIDEEDYTASFNFRFKRGGDFAVYGRLSEESTTVTRITPGEERPEAADYRYDSHNPYYGWPYCYNPFAALYVAGSILGTLAEEAEGAVYEDDPSSGNIGIFQYEGTDFVRDKYYHGLPKSSSTHTFHISSADIHSDRWYRASVTHKDEEMTLTVSGKEVTLPVEHKKGDLMLAVFDDAIVEISSLDVTSP